ncbi:MAG: cytochrome c [Chloroflexi bacterium]|nr:MAG: cytochrome c [Chloroflexota bacterium]
MKNNLFQKMIKGVGIFLGLLIGLLLIAVVSLYLYTDQQLNQQYFFSIKPIQITNNPETIERGNHLVENIAFCTDCHGDNLAGQIFDDGPMVGLLSVPNLTSGEGGIGRRYSNEDWVRAIRYGVGPDQRSLLGMASNFYYVLSDEDLAAVIAYVKSVPPVDNVLPPTKMGPMGRLLIIQDPTILPARVIDRNQQHPGAPEVGPTVEYGAYLGSFCTMCHGPDFSGGPNPGAGLNITPGGNIGHWNYDQFVQTIRTGRTPEGNELDPEMMPYDKLSNLSEVELQAIWLYLQTIPPIESPELTPGVQQ